MTRLEQANDKSLANLLAKNGYHPIRSHGSNQWYLSPFRSENNPSFIIRNKDGKWKDHGIDPDGLWCSNIDFVQLYFKLGVPEAISLLLEDSIGLKPYQPKPQDDRPYYHIENKLPINSRYLKA